MSQLLLEAAKQYLQNGLCAIAVNKFKKAFLPWSQYTEKSITEDKLPEQFNDHNCHSIAIICGKCSDNLEVIDIDLKYDLTGTLYDRYKAKVKDSDNKLLSKLMIIKTRSGGYHWYYRCEEIQGNLKLARRETNEEEKAGNINDKVRVLIETRGQGGYVLAPPSEGYKLVSGKKIATISVDEREILLSVARSFNELIDKPIINSTTKGFNPKEFGVSPLDDFNNRGDVPALLQQHGWTVVKENSERVFFRRPGRSDGTSGDYQKDKKWFSVFTTSSVFEPNKAYLPYAVYSILNSHIDFKQTAKELLNAGYGEKREYYGDRFEKDLYKKKREGLDRDALVQYAIANHKKGEPEAEESVDKLLGIWGEHLCTFWDISDTGKLSINRSRLIDFLYYNGGFSLYYYDKSSTIYRIVQERDGFIEEVSTEHIKKFLTSYIDSLPNSFDGGITSEDLKEIILKGNDTYFSKGLLEFLKRSTFEFLRDTEGCCYLPFHNGVVCIDRKEVRLLSYKDIKKVIWRSNVIDFDILVEKDLEYNLVEYFKFITLVCNKEEKRVEYALSIIGYLIHQYKDPTKPYSIILAEESEREEDGGGTGKGIFVKAISELINTVSMDGKIFKTDKSFAFQRVSLDTNLVSIEDCDKNIKFESFYSIITEGITVEKKNKDELFIPYKDSPKFVFTTNYTVPATGNHGKRRQKVFEFSNYFKPEHTPEDEFKHKLFDDWDNDERNRFYNLMFDCVSLFLEHGVMELKASETIKRKQIIVSYGEEFMDWFNNFCIEAANYRSTTECHNEFLLANGYSHRDYSIHRFKKGIKTAAKLFGFEISEHRNRQEANRKEISLVKSGQIKMKMIDEEDTRAPF